MTKERLLFGLGGIAVGVIIGFMFANSINRVPGENIPASNNSSVSAQSNSGLPPNHPPIGQTSGGDGNSAIPEVMAAIEKAKQSPDSFEAQMTAGDLYYQIQRFDDAATYYEAASRLKPGDVESMVKAGNARFDSEKYEAAEKWYRLALEKKPDPNVRSDLGLTYYLRTPQDIDQAIKEFKTSLELDPNHEMSLQNLTIAYIEKKDEANARATMETLRRVNPANPVLTRDRPAEQ